MTFADMMATDPPRLVVLFRRSEDGNEQFQWGIVGTMPVLTIIGAIVRVQAELAFRAPESCDQQALTIAWDANTRSVRWFAHPDIPIDPLVGMLETIKGAMVDSRLAQQAAAQQTRIVGPDGKPMGR